MRAASGPVPDAVAARTMEALHAGLAAGLGLAEALEASAGAEASSRIFCVFGAS